MESFSRIIIQWAELPCQDHNGEITGYIVEYSSTSPLHSSILTLSNSTRVVLDDLLPRTHYVLSVRAVGMLNMLSDGAITNISTGIPSGQ